MPILNIVVLVIVGLSAFIWATRSKGRGVFSSLINFLCVVCAGAIAFSVWEPLAYSVGLDLNQDLAWGLALAGPFIVVLLVLRIAVDQLVRANLDMDDVANFVGGALFGAASGIIVAGIFVIAMGFGRFGPMMMRYEPVAYDQGNLVVEKRLWLPVDRLTSKFYQHLSLSGFSSGTPMARYLPDPDVQAQMQRMVYVAELDGKKFMARNTMPPEAFQVQCVYRVEGPLNEILRDRNQPNRSQAVIYPDGETPGEGAHILGVVVQFNNQALEKKGQVIIGPGQARLVVTRDGTTRTPAKGIHAIACVASPESGAGSLYRFRFDGPEVFIPSLEAASTVRFALEFVVPAGYSAQHIVLKNAREPISQFEQTIYASADERDDAIEFYEIFCGEERPVGGAVVAWDDLDQSTLVTIPETGNGRYDDLTTSDRLPDNIVLVAGRQSGLELDPDNAIIGGRLIIPVGESKQRGVDRNLRIDAYAKSRTRGIVQVTFAEDGTPTEVGEAIRNSGATEPPKLIDTDGNAYDPVGYVYNDGSDVEIFFSLQTPVSELPPFTLSKRNQSIWIIYSPTSGVTINRISAGDKAVARLGGQGVEVRGSRR